MNGQKGSNMASKNPTKVITGPRTKMSYLHVLEPASINGSNPKYSGSFLIPKDSPDVEKITKAIQAAYEDGQAKLKGSSKVAPALAALKTPLRDGDAERPGDEAYAGYYFVNANNSSKPGVVDKDLNPIMDPDEVYSGIFGRVSLTFYAFNSNGNKGIACALNNIQKLADGPRLGGHASAAEDFGDLEDDDDFLD